MSQKSDQTIKRGKRNQKAVATTSALAADTNPGSNNSNSGSEQEEEEIIQVEEIVQREDELESPASLVVNIADLKNFLHGFQQDVKQELQAIRYDMKEIGERVIALEEKRSKSSSKANSVLNTPRNNPSPPRASVNSPSGSPMKDETNADYATTPVALRGFRREDFGGLDALPADMEDRVLPSDMERQLDARLEIIKRRDSVEGSILRFQQEDQTNRFFIASEKYLEINWKEKTVDGFLIFLEKVIDLRYYQGLILI